MKKRLLTVLLAVCLVVALGTVTAMADGTLPAPTDGVITLTEDYDLGTSRVEISENVSVIDLNGHTITGLLNVTHQLTIRDTSAKADGVIVAPNGEDSLISTIYVLAGGNLTIESGTIQAAESEGWGAIRNMGTLTINGGTVTGAYGIRSGAQLNGHAIYTEVSLTINDGIVHGDEYAIYTYGRGITNGDVTTVDNDQVTLNINGGRVESNEGIAIGTNASNGDYAGYTLNMTDGEVEGGITAMYLPAIGVNNISGGTITGEQAIRIASGELNITDGTLISDGNSVEDIIAAKPGGASGALVIGKAGTGYVGDLIVNVSGEARLVNSTTGENQTALYVTDKTMDNSSYDDVVIEVNIDGIEIDGDVLRTSGDSETNAKSDTTTLTIDSATITGDVINQSKKGGVTVNSSIVTGSVTVADDTDGTVAVFDSNIGSKSDTGVILVNTAVGEGDSITDTGNYVAVINGVGYTDLTSAIAAADDGDTIIVTGETKGDVVINKSVSDLTIRGEGGVIKNGTLSVASNGISLPDLTIEGLTFENANIVFSPNGASDLTNLTVTGNNFSGATSGLSAIHFNFGSLTDGSGVDFDGLTITDNNIEDITRGSNSGILIIGDGTTKSDITITGNTVDGVGWNGLQLNDIAGGEIIVNDNVFENCGATSPDGVLNLYNTKADTFAVNENVVIPNAGQMYVSNIADDVDLSKNYWGTATPDFENYLGYADESEVQVVTEPYYEAITMRPEDLNTYVPPVNIPDTYDIDLIVGEGGEAKTNFSNASAGTTITITVTPDEGYELDYITVDGERISGTTFKMPDHDVTVRVYFTDGSSTLPFTDVTANQWFYDAVAYVYTNGMMEGDSATTFNPDGRMTRAMFWAVLGRIDGATITGANWVETARSWAMAEGVSDGTNPNDYVTREMMVTMLWRYAGEPASEESLSGYSDAANVSDWAAEAMSWALETGVIEGVTATTLQPQGTATRAQCATIFMRYDALIA